MKARFLLCNVLLLAALCLTLERQALAYADAGTGLLILQSIGALFSGLLFYVRKHIKAALFKKRLERQ